MAGHDEVSYEWAIARTTELEVDLAAACSGLERAQGDNVALREIHNDLVNAYKRLQSQHERVREQLRRDQEETQQMMAEQQRQLAHARAQIEAKARECEELAHRAIAPREMEAIRLQITEEVEVPYQTRIQEAQNRTAQEQRRSSELSRQLERQRVEAKQREDELQEEIAELAKANRGNKDGLERKVSALEADNRRLLDSEAEVAKLKSQLRDFEAKTQALQKSLQDQELASEHERKILADDLQKQVEDASSQRRLTHSLQLQLDQEERKHAQLSANSEALRQEKLKIQQELEQAEDKVRAAALQVPMEIQGLKEEIAQLKSTLNSERDQKAKALKALKDEVHAAELSCKRSEAKLVQSEEEHREQLQSAQDEKEQAEQRLSLDNANLRSQLEAAERESESKRHSWREREVALQKQVEIAVSRVETLNDELLQCQVAQEEVERRLAETKREHQQHECALQAACQQRDQDLQSMREKIDRLEREISEKTSVAEVAQKDHQKQELFQQSLQAELASVNSRLNEERLAWAKDAEEASKAALEAEEKRRSAALQKQSEDHKRQMQKLVSATKKALQKAKLRQKEIKLKCQELTKRVSQLQSEKAMAVRVCQENKNAYELRLAELGLAFGASPHYGLSETALPAQSVVRASEAPAAGGMAHRRELRAISERLERHAEMLKKSHSAGEGAVSDSPNR
eukprot:TRINITY_DN10417_c7_g1_i1.p1 TRINITY_DN10417_c7_g1~~TRINITY_DN10417_c7_g1_i1.p1  ORF type:complete len:691 (-),score=227.91 TRINITY_DN10417_c7_g1_i1:160-2232(-)